MSDEISPEDTSNNKITTEDRKDLTSFISKLRSGPLSQDRLYIEYCNLINDYPFVQQILRKQPSRALFAKLIKQEALSANDLSRIQNEFAAMLGFIELEIREDNTNTNGTEKQANYSRRIEESQIYSGGHGESIGKLLGSQKAARKQFIHELVHSKLFNHVEEREKERVEQLILKEAELHPGQKISSIVRRSIQEQHPTWVQGETGTYIGKFLQALETRESGVFGRNTVALRSPEYLEIIEQNREIVTKIDKSFNLTRNDKIIKEGIELLEKELLLPVEERKIINPAMFVAALIATVENDPYPESTEGSTSAYKKTEALLEKDADQTLFTSNHVLIENAVRISNAIPLKTPPTVNKDGGVQKDGADGDGVAQLLLQQAIEDIIFDHYKLEGKPVPNNALGVITSFKATLSDPSSNTKIPGGLLTVPEAQARILQGAFINLDADPIALAELLGEDFVKSKIYLDMIETTRRDFEGKFPTHLINTKNAEQLVLKEVYLLQALFKTKEEAEKALGFTIEPEVWEIKITPSVATSQLKAFKALLSLDINDPAFPEALRVYITSLPGYKDGAPININGLVIFKYLELNALTLSNDNQRLLYAYLNNPKDKTLQEVLKKHGLHDLVKELPSGKPQEHKVGKKEKAEAAFNAAYLAYMAITHPDSAFMFALGWGAQIVVKKIFSIALKTAVKMGFKLVTKAAIGAAIKGVVTSAISVAIPIPILGTLVGIAVSYFAEKVVIKSFKVAITVVVTIVIIIAAFLSTSFTVNTTNVARGLIVEELSKNRAKPGDGQGGEGSVGGVDCATNPTDPICTLCAGTDGKYDIKKCPWPVATGCVSNTDYPGHKTERGGHAIDIGTNRKTFNVAGQPVRATYPGVVAEARWGFTDNTHTKDPNFGNMVRIRTSTNPSFTVIYAHLRRTNTVKNGDVVSPETIIGYVDSTGYILDSGSHLHMETNGVDIDSVIPSGKYLTCW